MDSKLQKAQEVVLALQDWIDTTSDVSSGLTVSLTWSEYMLAIEVNDIWLWDSENSDSELCFEACRDAFLAHIENFLVCLDGRRKEIADAKEATANT